MKNISFEKFYSGVYKIYKSVDESVLKALIPFIDLIRKFKNKPPVPKKEKFALFEAPKLSDKVIMLHGVSVGEIVSLENLIKRLKKEFFDYQLVITTGTVTGQELAKKKYSDFADFITYFPLDTYKTVKRFLDKINPSVILITETELWPNFSYCAKEKNIPLYIINGRISDKSYPSYLRIKGFLGLILGCFSGIFCQSETDKERFISIGAKENTVEVMKNLKFEIEKKPCDIDLKTQGFKTLIAASTHAGEDKIAFDTYKKLKEKNKDLKLILAPRHLTRLDEIKNLLLNYDFNYGYRTKNDNFSDKDVIILDTLGELSKIYEIVDVAYIGGSFNKTGGHNPLEAVIYSKPTVSGPSIKNFRDIYSILEHAKASFVVQNEEEFYLILDKLFSDKDFYKATSANCSACFQYQQGACDFVVKKLKSLL